MATFESRIRMANQFLSDMDEAGIETDRLASIKHSLTKLNDEVGKRGNNERFSRMKSQEYDELERNLLRSLEEEKKRINEALKSDDRMKQDDLTDQDYLDYLDTAEDITTHSLESLGLSSEQIGDFYKIAQSKGLDSDTINKLLKREIDNELERGMSEMGYRNISNPDRLSKKLNRSL